MSVLSAAQSAGIRLLGRKPASLFNPADVFGLELGELATEAATDIAEYYDWQKLTVLKSHAGDGTSIGFDLPADYGRMPKDGEVLSLTWQDRPFRKARDKTDWLRQQDIASSGTPGVWILLGGQMQIYPPMPVGEAARYYYLSNNIVADSAGLLSLGSGNTLIDHQGFALADDQGNQLGDFETFLSKTAFTDDNDVFVLSERLLTLSLIWRWRSQKRMEYSEDMANYENALEKAVAADKGARILKVGRQRVPAGVDAAFAYPGVLGR